MSASVAQALRAACDDADLTVADAILQQCTLRQCGNYEMLIHVVQEFTQKNCVLA